MNNYSLEHLADGTLLRKLSSLVSQDRATTAALLAHLAEVDTRKLYLPAAYPSMFQFCVEELHLSEEAAFKRIRAARAAREFPAIFDYVADGRLHLTAVVCLASHLTRDNADELLAAATHKSRAEIEQLLAERFPRPDLPARIRALPSPTPGSQGGVQLSPGTVDGCAQASSGPIVSGAQVSPGTVGGCAQEILGPLDGAPPSQSSSGQTGAAQLSPGTVGARPKVTPLAPQRFALQVTLGQSTHEKLRRAQELLSHQVPAGDLEKVLDLALDALVAKLEKRKFAATAKPRAGRRCPVAGERFVPAAVKRAVWERDRGRCTFISETGRRCPARKLLEFDHVDEVARGGRATVDGMRLRCRAHNQYGAECTFGAGFMDEKRHRARTSAREARAEGRGAGDDRSGSSA